MDKKTFTNRNDIPLKDRWATEDLYASDELWEQDIHWFVTEYGKVNLKGLSSWQRTEALISVAHPDFRDQLIKDAEKMGIWRNSNKR